MPRHIDADVFEVVTFDGKSDEFLDGAEYILEMIDSQPTVDIAQTIIVDLREALKPLTVDRLYDYPRSSYHRLNEIVKELETKYITDCTK